MPTKYRRLTASLDAMVVSTDAAGDFLRPEPEAIVAPQRRDSNVIELRSNKNTDFSSALKSLLRNTTCYKS